MPWADKEKDKAYHKSYSRAYQRQDPAKHVAYTIAWKCRNPEKVLLASAKVRAKTRGLPFTIDLSDIVIPERCPILGMPLDKSAPGRVGVGRHGGGAPRDNAPSLDRINPKLGYVRGNVHVISWRANSLKKDGTAAEMQLIADFLNKQDR